MMVGKAMLKLGCAAKNHRSAGQYWSSRSCCAAPHFWSAKQKEVAEKLQLVEQLGAASVMKFKLSDAPSLKVQTLTAELEPRGDT